MNNLQGIQFHIFIFSSWILLLDNNSSGPEVAHWLEVVHHWSQWSVFLLIICAECVRQTKLNL